MFFFIPRRDLPQTQVLYKGPLHIRRLFKFPSVPPTLRDGAAIIISLLVFLLVDEIEWMCNHDFSLRLFPSISSCARPRNGL